VNRINQRQGFLVSAVIHLTLLMMLLTLEPAPKGPTDLTASELEKRQVVFMPPASVLRQLAPPPAARPRPTPAPTPSAPDAAKKDRISVGPPSELRREGPMILRREDDLTRAPKGQPEPPAEQTPRPATPAPDARVAEAESKGGSPEIPGRQGLRLPPGLVGPPAPRGEDGSRPREDSIASSVRSAVDDLARRYDRLGVPTGRGQNSAGFDFDRRGADFTLWVSHLKDQVYRNWIMPGPALWGARGHVDFEFTVERDGGMSVLKMLKTSGNAALDKAARAALTSSRPLPLPDDYGPSRLSIQVTFFYNERPQGS